MALHIEDPEADRLARELAEQTGAPVEEAVVKALRAQLEKEREIARVVREVIRISEHYMSLPVLDPRTPDEILGYDEHGLLT
jgi:antitoxin VapB